MGVFDCAACGSDPCSCRERASVQQEAAEAAEASNKLVDAMLNKARTKEWRKLYTQADLDAAVQAERAKLLEEREEQYRWVEAEARRQERELCAAIVENHYIGGVDSIGDYRYCCDIAKVLRARGVK